MFKTSGAMLEAAFTFAALAHAGQLDKGGRPYILHPIGVMQKVNSDDDEISCICLLHDTVEDTETTFEDLREAGFTDRVIRGVDGMTKRLGETQDEYFARIKLNIDVVIVKIGDLEHNSDIRRLKGLTQKDFDRMQRYQRKWVELTEYRRQWVNGALALQDAH